MRERVMHVEHIQRFTHGDVGHLSSKRERVHAILKGRSSGELDAVKDTKVLRRRKTGGCPRREDVDGMAPAGELQCQLGGSDTASANGRKAGNSHAEGIHRSTLRTSAESGRAASTKRLTRVRAPTCAASGGKAYTRSCGIPPGRSSVKSWSRFSAVTWSRARAARSSRVRSFSTP